MKKGQIILLVYAAIVAAGGSSAYFSKGSMPSLIAGLVCGGLLAASYLVSRARLAAGYGSGIVVTLAMCVTFAIRWESSGKMMPSGMLFILSVVVLLLMLTVGRKELAGGADGGDSRKSSSDPNES